MEGWQGWPHERLVYLFLAIAYLAVWVQLTLYHWRGAFRSKAMWGPVIFTPVASLAALLYVFSRAEWAQSAFVVVFAIAALEGLMGTALHLKGVASQVGGFNLRNVTTGPPFVLPIMYMALAAFGLLVHYWDRIAGGGS